MGQSYPTSQASRLAGGTRVPRHPTLIPRHPTLVPRDPTLVPRDPTSVDNHRDNSRAREPPRDCVANLRCLARRALAIGEIGGHRRLDDGAGLGFAEVVEQ